MQFQVELCFWQRIVRNFTQFLQICASENAQHARHRLRLCRVYRLDERVRMCRPHHRRVDLTGLAEVIGESSASRQQAHIFLTPDTFTDDT